MSAMLDRGDVDDPYYFLDPENKYSRMIKKHASEQDPRVFQLRKTASASAGTGSMPDPDCKYGCRWSRRSVHFWQKRSEKVNRRECLRLQSFPDNFSFPESLNRPARYRMIGNAVNVNVSFGIAKYIHEKLSEIKNESVMDISA